MHLFADQLFDLTAFWTWLLLSIRTAAVFTMLPGIGGSDIPGTFRGFMSAILAYAITISGVRAANPDSLAEAAVMIGCELVLGFVLASVPLLIVQALAIAGQIVSGSIGLGFASMFDPVSEQSVPVLARIQTLVGSLFFILISGHHIIIQAIAGVGAHNVIGEFRPGQDVQQIYLEQFVQMFEFSIAVSGPVLVAALLAQFVLGLITKSVPQLNVFIVSLPLTIGLGLYLTAFNLPGLVEQLLIEFGKIEEVAARVMFTGPT